MKKYTKEELKELERVAEEDRKWKLMEHYYVLQEMRYEEW